VTEFVPQIEHSSFPLEKLLLVMRIVLNPKICCILQCKAAVAVDEPVVEMGYVTFTSIVLVVLMIRRYSQFLRAAFEGWHSYFISRSARALMFAWKPGILTKGFIIFLFPSKHLPLSCQISPRPIPSRFFPVHCSQMIQGVSANRPSYLIATK